MPWDRCGVVPGVRWLSGSSQASRRWTLASRYSPLIATTQTDLCERTLELAKHYTMSWQTRGA